MYFNAQSLLCNKDEIVRLVNDNDIDIVFIAETWLLPTINDSIVEIPSFSVYRNDSGYGGGVCIYVRNYFNVRDISTSLDKID